MQKLEWTFVYRQGYFKALLDISNLLLAQSAKSMSKHEILLTLKAAPKFVEALMEYGERCEIWYAEHKKGIPTKVEINPYKSRGFHNIRECEQIKF